MIFFLFLFINFLWHCLLSLQYSIYSLLLLTLFHKFYFSIFYKSAKLFCKDTIIIFFSYLPQGSEEEKDVKAEKSVTISGKNMTDITYAVELINLRVREWMRINAERISMNVKSNVTAEINGKIRKMVSSDLAAVRGDPYGGYSGILHNQNINVLSSNNNNNNDNMMHSQYQQQLLLSQQQQYQQQSLNQGYNNQQYPLSLQPVLGQNQYPTNNQQQRQHNSGY